MKKNIIRRYIKPSHSFLLVLVFLVFLPNAYMYAFDFYSERWVSLGEDNYKEASGLALTSTSLYLFFFILGYATLKIIKKRSAQREFIRIREDQIPNKSLLVSYYSNINVFCILHKHKIILLITVISSFLVWVNFILGGYEKISLLGSDMSKQDFRLIGFDDKSRILTAILQIARRLLLPFGIVYIIFINRYHNIYSRKVVAYLLITLVVGIIITLDRAPVMMFIIMVAYIKYCSMRRASQIIYIGPLVVSIIILLGGSLTYIQHNLQDYNFIDVISTGTQFLFNRAILAPNYVPIELSYGKFDLNSDKLLLEYTRLNALFGGAYVGTTELSSQYVSPVGSIADIWRNLGFPGIIAISYMLGLYYGRLDQLVKQCDPVSQCAISFTAITLSFYFLYGTFFSQGVFLQIIFIYIATKYLVKEGRLYTTT